MNYKINQQQCDFLMLHCCSGATATERHIQNRTEALGYTYANGKRENSLLGGVGEKVGAAYFLNKLMLCLTVETCNKNDAK